MSLGERLLQLGCALHRLRHRGAQPEAEPRVLAIVSNTALGDTLLSTPVVASARASFPCARILFVIHPRYAALFSGLPEVDALLTYDGGYRQLPFAVSILRRQGVDTVLLAHSNGPQDIALGCLSGASTLLKPATQSPLRGFLSTQMPPLNGHVIEARCALVRALGGTGIHTRMVLPPRYFADIPERFPRLPSPAIGFQLGAANHYKMWPLENFAMLAKRLLELEPTAHIVLTGSPGERALARRFLARVADARILDHTGRHPVEDLPWLLRQLDVLVTNDTGPMHLAIALGVSTVSLFGLTSSRLIGPYQDLDKHIVLQSPLESTELHLPKKQRSNQAMAVISVEAVAAAVCKLMETSHARPAHH